MPKGKTLEVSLKGSRRRYPIIIRDGLLSDIGPACREVLPKAGKALLLSDGNVSGHYGEAVAHSLSDAGFVVETLTLPAGEGSKSLAQAEKIYQRLAEREFSRSDALVALGGGVMGDLGGFCASTWHRGMAVVQVPTSLIAQVDSSMGGKTAVNLPAVKNAVGTFYQPAAVLMDPRALATLPDGEVRAGLAEVFKYSLIETACTGENGFFEWLDAHADNLPAVYEEMIARCAAIKAAVIMKDETDTKGLRALLNLGHTFGHAYEALSRYEISHGDAVALGILDAVGFSVRTGLLGGQAAKEITTLHQRLGLPQVPPDYPYTEMIACMRQDKKASQGRIQLVLPVETIGKAALRDNVTPGELGAFLSR